MGKCLGVGVWGKLGDVKEGWGGGLELAALSMHNIGCWLCASLTANNTVCCMGGEPILPSYSHPDLSCRSQHRGDFELRVQEVWFTRGLGALGQERPLCHSEV